MSDVSEYSRTDESDHERAKHIIAKRLATDHVGRTDEDGNDNTISSRDLAEYTPVSASTVRDLIVEVRREYLLPIASANGYYVAQNNTEACEFIERQREQARTSRRRARDFARAFNQSQDCMNDADRRNAGGRLE